MLWTEKGGSDVSSRMLERLRRIETRTALDHDVVEAASSAFEKISSREHVFFRSRSFAFSITVFFFFLFLGFREDGIRSICLWRERWEVENFGECFNFVFFFFPGKEEELGFRFDGFYTWDSCMGRRHAWIGAPLKREYQVRPYELFSIHVSPLLFFLIIFSLVSPQRKLSRIVWFVSM